MLILLFAGSVLSALASDQVAPGVTIAQGTVIGSEASDGNYFEFHGIPYADSTSGSHRFKAPRPAPYFSDALIANRRNIKCVRALGVGYEGTEDCLVANIFTPTINNTRQLPVMVWIKGKEFDGDNEQSLSFRNFVEKDVIVVSLNYRESILGFLCLGTETAPGNAGLKDIIAGLRWVQQNIEQFGGNPRNVTLFGHGSGAAAVDLVTLSPMGNGLVQKAIAQSGNAMAPWAVSRDNLEYAVQVAEALGHKITNIQELSEVFTRTSVAALMAVINELDLTDNSLAFAPCIERQELQGVEPFLIKTPAQAIAAGDFLQIPFMTGFVDNEGTIRAEEALEDDWLERMNDTFTEFLQPDLQFQNSNDESQVAQSIRTFYFGENPINITNVDEFIRYHGDTMMLVSTIREARNRAFTSTAATYLYQFSYKGFLGGVFESPLRIDTAAHSDELAYMFYGTPVHGTYARDLTIGDILVERWTNFAKTGIPTSETSQVLWRPFTSLQSFYLRVLDNNEINNANGATLELSLQNPHPNTITFWEQIYQNHFLDAESNWELDDRNENVTTTPPPTEESDSGETTTTSPPTSDADGEQGTTSSPPSEGDDGEQVTTTSPPPTEGSENGSASNAVGYTFLIVVLFSLLNQLHSTQILS